MKRLELIRNDLMIVLAAVPLYFVAAGRYGLRIFVFLALSCLAGFFTEWIARRWTRSAGNAYCFSGWILFPLVLPPALPLWMGVLSLIFGLTVTVVFFGGHGRQWVSPVAVGWAFAVLSFSTAYGFGWSFPFPGPLDGFSQWLANVPTIDDPSVLFSLRINEFLLPILNGAFPQTPGGTLPLLTLGAGIFLLIARAVDFRSSVSFLGSYLVINILFRYFAPEMFPGMTSHLVGSLLFVSFFLLPDGRTSSRTFAGRWLVGLVAGLSAFLIRHFSSYPGGIVFAVLLANVFSAIIDEGVLTVKYWRKYERS